MKKLYAVVPLLLSGCLYGQVQIGSGVQVGGSSAGTSLGGPVVSLPTYETVSSDGEYITVGAGATQTMLNLGSSVSGTVISIWACESVTNGQGYFNVYEDGASSPQVQIDQLTLGVYSQSANTQAYFLRGMAQTATATNLICTRFGWPIAFQNGIKIDFVSFDSGSITLFYSIQYTTGLTSPLRLYSKGVTWQNRVTGQNLATTNYTFLSQSANTGISTYTIGSGGTGYSIADRVCAIQTNAVAGCFTVSGVSSGVITALTPISAGGGYSVASGVSMYGGHGSGATLNITATGTNGPGLLAGHYLSGQGASGTTWAEADQTIYLDGSGTASFVSPGTEDAFGLGLGYYWDNGTVYSSPYSIQTHSNPTIINFADDFLDYSGGFRFNNGINFVWDGTTHDSGRISTTVSFTYAALYYQ